MKSYKENHKEESLEECIAAAKAAWEKAHRKTSVDFNYRPNKATCRYCAHQDLIRENNGCPAFICELTKEGTEDFMFCDEWQIAKA